jgi:hypothetical protein
VVELELLLLSSRAELGCVMETWAHDNIPEKSLNIEGFQVFM